MMGLPVKGHILRRVHQQPVAKGFGATVAAAPKWKRTLPAPLTLSLPSPSTPEASTCLVSPLTLNPRGQAPPGHRPSKTLTSYGLIDQDLPPTSRGGWGDGGAPLWRGHNCMVSLGQPEWEAWRNEYM